jgi:dTDP-4-amino-4,6-dideoxygalactose transaminase
VLNSKRICRNTFLSLDDLVIQPYSCCKTLENKIANTVKKKYCVVVNSCTSALECAFHAIGIKNDDEVLVPTYNYIGAAASMMHNGGIPVLCDIDDSFMINPNVLYDYEK